MLRGVECGESPDPVPPPSSSHVRKQVGSAMRIYTCPAMPVASPGDRSAMHEISPSDLKTILHSKRANLYYLEHCRVLVNGGRVEYVTDEGSRSAYWEHPDCQHHDPSARNGNLHHPGRHEGNSPRPA